MLSVKVLFLISLLYLIWTFSRKQQEIDWTFLLHRFFTIHWLAWSFLLAFINWFLRIYKWKTAVKPVRNISLKTAAEQQLTAFAWSVFTPANAGEFLHKPLFFHEKKAVAKAVLAEQLSQMFITSLLGILSFAYFYIHPIAAGGFAFISAIMLGLSCFYRPYACQLILLSLLRYVSFGLFLYSGLSHTGLTHISAGMIPIYFLVVSLLPLLPWTDIPVKSSVALWIFSVHPGGSSSLLALMFWLWVWNTFLPALAGQILGIYKTARL